MTYSKKEKVLIGILLGVIIVSGLTIFSYKNVLQEKIRIIQENIGQGIVSAIDYGEGTPETFKTGFKEGMTAFDLLKEETEEANIALETKNYDIGILIETIGNKKNGEDGKYWLYYVNGELPPVAADKKEIKPGDKVEFKFEKSPF